VLRINQAAAASIRDGKTPQLVSILQTGRNEGMIPMDRCVQQLVDKGLVRDD
jgi:twitching motility protein PilT